VPGWAEVAAEVARHAESDPRREVCGVVFREVDGSLTTQRVANDADRWAAADPASFPGGARDGFVLAPRELRRALDAARARGATLRAVYHSHVDAPAALSTRDLALALDGGAPALPGVDLVVVAVRAGRAGVPARFAWNGAEFAAVRFDAAD
jgi:proteasome lid subunit RPN8/RPN11